MSIGGWISLLRLLRACWSKLFQPKANKEAFYFMYHYLPGSRASHPSHRNFGGAFFYSVLDIRRCNENGPGGAFRSLSIKLLAEISFCQGD